MMVLRGLRTVVEGCAGRSERGGGLLRGRVGEGRHGKTLVHLLREGRLVPMHIVWTCVQAHAHQMTVHMNLVEAEAKRRCCLLTPQAAHVHT